ncbi:hypothetical protein Phi18:3_gp116 [Cellulophaga phage phi18:3]|uniref:Uncharacterized protein n=1 Tax=Cellulophaga phage phi18:3 TaxID=1327983 RepID=S0A371_9CAUD|nr:hypothetical protein Phi18:3_gp116 [Cellulophaga phage phi18:3]AGO48628.1 hypothetical protein Phi18:3_gp116 [Cellulophaga phage phi18:3]
MKTRLLENSDYETLVGFWKANRFPPPSFDDLPTVNGELQGVMVHMEGVNICAGFIIDTTIKNGAMIEYIVANFDIKDRGIRKDALVMLINKLSELGKFIGKKYVFTSVKNQNLIKSFEDSGFNVGSSNTMEMIKIV